MVNQRKAGARLAKRLGANIAERRKLQKRSQAQLAEKLGVATETISRFERGATLPSLVTLQRLGHILRAPITLLLADTQPNRTIKPPLFGVAFLIYVTRTARCTCRSEASM